MEARNGKSENQLESASAHIVFYEQAGSVSAVNRSERIRKDAAVSDFPFRRMG